MRVLSAKEVDSVSGGLFFSSIKLNLNLKVSLFDWCKPKPVCKPVCKPAPSCGGGGEPV